MAQIMPLHQTFFFLFSQVFLAFPIKAHHYHALKAMLLQYKTNAFILQLHCYYGAKTMLFALLSHSLSNPLVINQIHKEKKSFLEIQQ